MGEKDEYLRRLGEICDRADGCQEEKSLSDKAETDGDLYENVWKEAAVDPYPPEGVIQLLRNCNVGIKSYVFDKCGNTPWREEFARVLFSELYG